MPIYSERDIVIIEENQEPGGALVDAMRSYGDEGSQALAGSIYSGVQFGFAAVWLYSGSAASPVPLSLWGLLRRVFFFFRETIANKHQSYHHAVLNAEAINCSG